MADIVSPAVRSRMMAGIRAKNTNPEIVIRRGLFKRGHRYRLHDSRLPGKPDLVFRKHGAVIFVHGCFWHRHDCSLFKWPSTNSDFWRKKISGNRALDLRVVTELRKRGWRVLTLWECAIKRAGPDEIVSVIEKVHSWLISGGACAEIRASKLISRKR